MTQKQIEEFKKFLTALNDLLIVLDINLKKIIVIMLIVLIQGESIPQENQNPKQKNDKNSQTLTAEQTAQIKTILSQYNASTLTAKEAKEIHEKFREAGIHAGPETKDAIIAAGFDPEKLRTLAPPPTHDKKDGSNPSTIEERLKVVEEKIIKPLSLNSTQKESVSTAFKEFFTEVDTLVKNQSNSQGHPDKSKIKTSEKVRDEKVKQVLSDEQFTKYLELEKNSRPVKSKDKESQQN
jgi:hypothetical protein